MCMVQGTTSAVGWLSPFTVFEMGCLAPPTYVVGRLTLPQAFGDSPVSALGGQTYPPALYFPWLLGFELRYPYLHGQCFANSALSPGPSSGILNTVVWLQSSESFSLQF